MKKYLGILVMSLAVIFMTACSSNNSNQSSSNSSTTSTKKSDSNDDGVWNSTKDKQLSDFMQSWGTQMNQSYKEVTPKNSIDINSFQFPKDALNNENLTLKDDLSTHYQLKWYNKDLSSDEYQVVAAYNASHTNVGTVSYLFVIQNNKAMVWQVHPSSDSKKATVSPTANTDLSGGFTNIVNGDASSNNNSSNNASDNSNKSSNKETTALSKYQLAYTTYSLYYYEKEPGLLGREAADPGMVGFYNNQYGEVATGEGSASRVMVKQVGDNKVHAHQTAGNDKYYNMSEILKFYKQHSTEIDKVVNASSSSAESYND
jgi:hypothetical protein